MISRSSERNQKGSSREQRAFNQDDEPDRGGSNLSVNPLQDFLRIYRSPGKEQSFPERAQIDA